MKGSEPVVLRHALPTSGVIYMDVAFDLSRVPQAQGFNGFVGV